MLANFFFLSLQPLFCGAPRILQSGAKPGVWERNPQTPKNFYGFHVKNTHLSTLFIEKERTVPEVIAVSDR